MDEHAADRGKRTAQHLLASEVLELVHGPESAARTREEHHALRRPNVASLSTSPAESTATGAQHTVLPRSLVYNQPFSRILYHAGIVATKSEGARLIAKGGVSVASISAGEAASNDEVDARDADQLVWNRIEAQQQQHAQDFLINGRTLMFRVGKWKVKYVDVAEDAEFDEKDLRAPGWAEFKAGREE